MAKGKVKFPLDSIKGTLSGVDRTIGRNPGFVAVMRGLSGPSTVPHSPTYNTSIAATKAPTRGGSAERHTRAEVYCGCDAAYKLLGEAKQAFLEPWFRAVMNNRYPRMAGYHIYMKVCLKYMEETGAFTQFSYVSRFRIFNVTSSVWQNKQVELSGIPSFQWDGQDIEIYQLLRMSTKIGNSAREPLMIDMRLTHEVREKGKALVTVPFLVPFDSMLVDVYSYFRRYVD